MKKLVDSNLIMIPNFKDYQEPQNKLPWYNEKDLCDFQKIKGHKTSNYMRLKNIIQDLIESEDISIEVLASNQDLKIYKNPMLDHRKGNNTGKAKDYINMQHTYSNVVTSCDKFIIVITIKGPSTKCGVTTPHGKVTIQGAPSQSMAQATFPTPNPSKYNILD